MPYSPTQIQELLSFGENERVEFKSDLRDPEVLSRLISAFGNSSGGVILIGVGQYGQVIGTRTDRISRVFHSALGSIINPPKVDLEATTVNGKSVAIITVGKSEGVTFSEAGAFARVGETVRPLPTPQLLHSLQEQPLREETLLQLARSIPILTAKIAELQDQLDEAKNWKSRVRSGLVAGTVGAIAGYWVKVLLSRIWG